MRVGVLGTCQAEGFAASVRALLPAAEVRHFFLGACDPDEVHAFAAASDLFLAQPVAAPEFGRLRTAELPQAKLALLPHVVFTGFHPDIVVVPAWGARHSPFSGYHSAIVAACWRLGIPAERVPGLFNRYVYAALGYLGEFDRARDFLVQSCGALGLDIGDRIASWARAGSFMHTINHPGIGVLLDLVRLRLAQLGLVDAAAEVAPPPDALGIIRWPVFDIVADPLGIPAEPSFHRIAETMSLEDFVACSYAAYAEADGAVLAAIDGVARAEATLARIGLR